MTKSIIINENWKIRAPEWDDLEAVNDLYNRYMQDVLGINFSTPEGLRADWTFPNMTMADDFRIVFNENNVPIGYASVWNHSEPHTNAFINLMVDPAYKDHPELNQLLLSWVEERGRETLQKAPSDAKLTLSADIYVHQTELQALLTEADFHKSRNFWTMKIGLDQAIPEPQFPENIKIVTHLDLNDLTALCQAVDDSFRDHWGHVSQPIELALETWEHWSNVETNPEYDGSMWFIAMDGDEIAGVSLCTAKTQEDKTMGYVYTLGVRRAWRRQGLALALLHHSFGEMKARGLKSASLDVDAQSLTGATRLYEKAGMHVWRHSEAFEKVIRDGIDYRTQELED